MLTYYDIDKLFESKYQVQRVRTKGKSGIIEDHYPLYVTKFKGRGKRIIKPNIAKFIYYLAKSKLPLTRDVVLSLSYHFNIVIDEYIYYISPIFRISTLAILLSNDIDEQATIVEYYHSIRLGIRNKASRRYRKASEDEVSKILEMYKQGFSISAIAKELNRPVSTIYYILKRYGLK